MGISRQAQAKLSQGYEQNPLQKRCMLCRNKKLVEGNIWCRIGDFAVKANALCDCWEPYGGPLEAKQ